MDNGRTLDKTTRNTTTINTGTQPVKVNVTHTEPSVSIRYTVTATTEKQIRCHKCNSLLGRMEGVKGTIKIQCGKSNCKHDNILKVA